jgi:hypothetical protein
MGIKLLITKEYLLVSSSGIIWDFGINNPNNPKAWD